MDHKALVKLFEDLGQQASYHYADDSTGEWGAARRLKEYALQLFDACPELQPKMREIARDFLWRLNLERPID